MSKRTIEFHYGKHTKPTWITWTG